VEVLIVDDQARFWRMARTLIESQPEYRVCGEAGDGIEALEKKRCTNYILT
jgi:DNA-binding NarL/FixJ family response regulator